jgi:hypothetical protein
MSTCRRFFHVAVRFPGASIACSFLRGSCLLAAVSLGSVGLRADYYSGFETPMGFTSSPSYYVNDHSATTGWITSDTTPGSYQVWAGPPGTYPSGGVAPTSGSTGIPNYQGTQALCWKGTYGRSAYHNMGTNSPSHHFRVQVAMLKGSPATTGDLWCAIQRGTDTATRSAGFGFHGDQLGYYSNGVWVNSGGTITANTWYKFDCYVNTYTGTFTVVVNDALTIASNVASWSAGAGASDTVYFWRSSGGTNAAVDGLHCWLYDCVNVATSNLYIGAERDADDHTTVNYETSLQLAQWVATVPPTLYNWYPPIAVIGAQELISDSHAQTLVNNLEAQTGVNWEYARTPGGVNGTSGVGFFWRTDLATDLGSLGSTTIFTLDNGYVMPAAGRLFRHARDGTTETFGVFTTKLAWNGAVLNGHAVTDQDRINQANALMTWIRNGSPGNPGMSGNYNVTRIICIDNNTASDATFLNEYADSGGQNTLASNWGTMSDTTLDANGAKLDHTWWDWDGGSTKVLGGFALTPKRSTYFGSDHRAVWAYVKIH